MSIGDPTAPAAIQPVDRSAISRWHVTSIVNQYMPIFPSSILEVFSTCAESRAVLVRRVLRIIDARIAVHEHQLLQVTEWVEEDIAAALLKRGFRTPAHRSDAGA